MSSNGESIDENEIAPRTRVLDGVKTALRTQPHSFVQGFLEVDGLPVLLNLLQHMDYPTAQSSTHTSLIGCLKALMNNSVMYRFYFFKLIFYYALLISFYLHVTASMTFEPSNTYTFYCTLFYF